MCDTLLLISLQAMARLFDAVLWVGLHVQLSSCVYVYDTLLFARLQAKARKTAVNPETLKRLSAASSALHKDYSQLKMVSASNFDDLKQMIKQVRFMLAFITCTLLSHSSLH